MLSGEKKGRKEFFGLLGKFLVFSIIAVMIASVILIPVFIGLRSGRADFSFSNFDFRIKFNLADCLAQFFTGSFVEYNIGNDGYPPIFCGVIINFLVILYFMNSKIGLKKKIFSGLMILLFFASFYVEGLNLVWYLGNVPACFDYRYAFCFAFFYIFIASEELSSLKER